MAAVPNWGPVNFRGQWQRSFSVVVCTIQHMQYVYTIWIIYQCFKQNICNEMTWWSGHRAVSLSCYCYFGYRISRARDVNMNSKQKTRSNEKACPTYIYIYNKSTSVNTRKARPNGFASVSSIGCLLLGLMWQKTTSSWYFIRIMHMKFGYCCCIT